MKAFILLAMVITAGSVQIKFYNNCRYTVWPGISGNVGKGHPEGGGFVLEARESRIVNVARDWAGIIWPRTHCDSSGHCMTGDCGNGIQCNGRNGIPPVSIAEFTLSGYGGLDYYDINLNDGFNVPLKIEPTDGFRKRNHSSSLAARYDCTPAGCHTDLNSNPFISSFRYRSLCLNSICPEELAVKMGRKTIACMSACFKFNTDQYCCRGHFQNPKNCQSTDWPINYPAIIERACPTAYSYGFYEGAITFTCLGDPVVNYRLVFCP